MEKLVDGRGFPLIFLFQNLQKLLNNNIDYRYVGIRKASGSSFWFKSLFTVFWFQAVILPPASLFFSTSYLLNLSFAFKILCWIISQPFAKIFQAKKPTQITPQDILGTILWVIGFFFETVGDLQLASFKSNPQNRGKLLTTGIPALLLSHFPIYSILLLGLWRFTRHPNYFGNACMFWGFFSFACAEPGGFQSVFSPLLLNYLLLKVSGVSLLERSLQKRKPGFNEYSKNTSSFIPWFPAK